MSHTNKNQTSGVEVNSQIKAYMYDIEAEKGEWYMMKPEDINHILGQGEIISVEIVGPEFWPDDDDQAIAKKKSTLWLKIETRMTWPTDGSKWTEVITLPVEVSQ